MTEEKKQIEEVSLTDELTAVLEEIVEDTTEEKKEEKPVFEPISESEFMLLNRQYRLVTNYREGFNAEKLAERYSDVLGRYDYVVGDWGYEQLRLKGFFATSNKRSLPEQRIDSLQDYLYEYCNFGCAYFVIERVGDRSEDNQPKKTNKPRNNQYQKNNQQKNTQTKNKSQAHISEKRENVSGTRAKPKMKTRKSNQPKPTDKRDQQNKKSQKPAQTTKKSFTIRQRDGEE